jgi:tyrosyl-tRNA synthetase
MITEMYHGKLSAENAKQRYLQVAGGAAPTEMHEFIVSEPEIMLCELLKQVGFAASNGDARRNIAGRGIKLAGVTVEDPMLKVSVAEPFVLQFGKNKFIKIRSDDHA